MRYVCGLVYIITVIHSRFAVTSYIVPIKWILLSKANETQPNPKITVTIVLRFNKVVFCTLLVIL